MSILKTAVFAVSIGVFFVWLCVSLLASAALGKIWYKPHDK